MRTSIAIASASTTMMRVSDQLDLDVLVPMLIQGAPLRRRTALAGARVVRFAITSLLYARNDGPQHDKNVSKNSTPCEISVVVQATPEMVRQRFGQ
jgi:hypothetical protein